jgi:cation diffusion facilitator CzcD-associated flavoprotein CzcO
MTASGDGLPTEDGLKMMAAQQKYAEEAAKRLRPDGLAQYVELKDAESDRFRALGEDPWADHAALNAQEAPIKDGGKYKFAILGAGYAGLLIAVRLLQAGAAKGSDDIRLIDAAGGFGGTWYWNRYPGLRCDVESYTYMPLLEETGYVPTENYATGSELREHAERITGQYNLHDKALFRTTVHSTTWDDKDQLWTVKVTQNRGPGEEGVNIQFQAQYVLVASGILTRPQVPKIPGLESFSGAMFHTARWDYSVTGGSPTDPNLEMLKDKRVGIIGTGATAIQAVPQLAKYAKEVYVFQRTPSAVHWRGLKKTDPEVFKTKVAAEKGWQINRRINFQSYMNNAPAPGQENLVGDAWTELPAYCAIMGTPGQIIEPTPEKIGEHVGRLYGLDMERAERARSLVDEVVKDKDTAAKLKAWYPVWCKRPTFSDDYLDCFNQPNVHLVDTDGKGLSSATTTGLVFQGKEYPLDVLVLSTGYRSPAIGNGSPAVRTGIEIVGRGHRSLDEKWQTEGASTLHGLCSNGFPNLFFVGPSQGGSAANFVMALDIGAEHMAYIISEAERKNKTILEVSTEAEKAWTMECLQRAAWFSGVAGCTPGYINSEGESMAPGMDPQQMMKLATAAGWGEGVVSYMKILEDWKAAGDLKGFL